MRILVIHGNSLPNCQIKIHQRLFKGDLGPNRQIFNFHQSSCLYGMIITEETGKTACPVSIYADVN